ncbi:MAG: TadE family protein [Alphaproteobacteria bacterium]
MIEFAFVAGPFVALTIGIIELGLAYWATTLLDTATQETARQIRTGELQQAAAAEGEEATAEELFRDAVCDAMDGLLACDSANDNFYFDVRNYPGFGDVNMSPPETEAESGAILTTFNPGSENEVILVRTYYRWDVVTPGMKYLMSNHVDATGRLVLESTVAFRNEPFPSIE